MPTSNLSAASYRRTLDDCLRQTFAAERQYQNARMHLRIELDRKVYSSDGLRLAVETLDRAEMERNYTVGLAEFAHKVLIEAELAEIAEGRSFLANSGQVEVLPFVAHEEA